MAGKEPGPEYTDREAGHSCVLLFLRSLFVRALPEADQPIRLRCEMSMEGVTACVSPGFA